MSSHLARLEALLFVAGEDGLSLRTMAQLLEIPVTGLTQSLEKLQAKYEADEDTALCLLESSLSLILHVFCVTILKRQSTKVYPERVSRYFL